MLIAAVIVPFFSYFCFKQIEYLINHDLYSYGLVFSSNWANLYSLYASLYTFSLLLLWFLLSCSIISFLAYDITKRNSWRSVCVSVLAIGAISNFFNVYVFYRLDSLVNSDLYVYGLRFSYDWYSNYTSILLSIWFLVGAEIFFILASAILIPIRR